ncbi:hypothetical protein OO013_15420 [Mangrovivirga sp. M17]|uniref:Collagen-like protein n=1 Tax=Mangrovivirga halotolerans TaxID=2993936 RepID=A0ABT3RVK1_9BACT|nr:hypothetical protein [Mangrovivirga halotolerans]MCX2745267.1 hypothetical protein [Mangrovivirga halotolerans]
MKTIIKLFIPVLFLVISACEGPRGPVGPQGPQGPEGGLLLAQVFETEPVSFFEEDGWQVPFDIPLDFEIFESDIIVAYILWNTDNGVDNWRALPQFVYQEEPNFVYNFQYSINEVIFYMDSDIPSEMNNLPVEYLDNQIFRFVVIPAEFASAKVDLTNYEEVTKMLDLDEDDVVKIKK